jgi:hypothetical protein
VQIIVDHYRYIPVFIICGFSFFQYFIFFQFFLEKIFIFISFCLAVNQEGCCGGVCEAAARGVGGFRVVGGGGGRRTHCGRFLGPLVQEL